MRRLWIADVHASLPALEAVLEDAGQVDEVVFLGDLVGYGPHPAECIDVMRGLGVRAIAGNHDLEMLSDSAGTLPLATSADQVWRYWTYQCLEDHHRSYLSGLPTRIDMEIGGLHLVAVHKSTRGGYLHPAMPDSALSAQFADLPGDTVFFGHSHWLIDRTVDRRRLVGPKAVGQHRDGDPRAGYCVEQEGQLIHRVVSYDIERVLRDISDIPLPPEFAARWARYMRTGFDPEWSREWAG